MPVVSAGVPRPPAAGSTPELPNENVNGSLGFGTANLILYAEFPLNAGNGKTVPLTRGIIKAGFLPLLVPISAGCTVARG